MRHKLLVSSLVLIFVTLSATFPFDTRSIVVSRGLVNVSSAAAPEPEPEPELVDRPRLLSRDNPNWKRPAFLSWQMAEMVDEQTWDAAVCKGRQLMRTVR